MLAEIGEGDPRREIPGRKRLRRPGQEDLSAMACRRDPRRAVDVEPDVGVAAEHAVAGVQAHPHPHDGAGRPGLCREGRAGPRWPRQPRGERKGRPRRRRLLGADLGTAAGCDRFAEQGVVALEDRDVGVSEGLDQALPSMSVNRNVTVPVGRVGIGG